VIDPQDGSQADAIRKLDLEVAIAPTVMKTRVQKRKLARVLLALP
jgi:hypothetical protein